MKVPASTKTYGRVSLRREQGRLFFLIDPQPHVALRLKDIFRKIAKVKRSEGYLLSVTDDSAKDLLWFSGRYPMSFDADALEVVTEGADAFDQKQQRLEKIFLPEVTPSSYEIALPPRDYQARFADVLYVTKRMINGDEMGLGKTLQGILLLSRPGTLPALVVTQTHLPVQWKAQIAKFFPKMRVHIVKSRTPYELPPADVYITSYTKIIGWNDILSTGYFKYVVFDEVHELRRTDTEKYKAAKLVTAGAEYVVGLSATPIFNLGGEAWALCDLIKEGSLGTQEEFRREWCSSDGTQPGKLKVDDPVALGQYMRENFLMIRRTRAEVGRELPPVNTIVHNIEYDEQVEARAASKLAELAARVQNGSFTERGLAARKLDVLARMVTGVAKAKAVAEYVRELLDNGEAVILGGWHRDVYDIWNRELAAYTPLMYTGEESPKEKAASVEKWLSGGSNLLLISLRSGSGLDGLQVRRPVIVHGELDWSPATHQQLRGRAHRDGVEGSVTEVFLNSNGGTDPLMLDVLGIKASQSYGILNPEEDVVLRDPQLDADKESAAEAKPVNGSREISTEEGRGKALAKIILQKELVPTVSDFLIPPSR